MKSLKEEIEEEIHKKQRRTKKALAKLEELQKKNKDGDFDWLLEKLSEGSGDVLTFDGVTIYFTKKGRKIEIRLADGNPPSINI